MKSKVNLAIMALGFSLVTATQADVTTERYTSAPPTAIGSVAVSGDFAGKMEAVEQGNEFAIIQPCYRWPHPCD